VHWVGAQYAVSGALGGGTGTVVLGVGNGRGDNVDDIRVTSDTNDAKAALLKLRYKTSTFEVGLGAIYDLIAPASVLLRPALPDRQIHELIGNAYVVVRSDGPIVIGEGYVIRHQAGRSTTTFGGYGLFGFAVTSWLTPYAAIDVVDGANDDPFFVPDPMTAAALDVVEGIVGARFETSTWSAFKLELRYETRPGESDATYAAAANWSFGL
jgi:hypothetical protein